MNILKTKALYLRRIQRRSFSLKQIMSFSYMSRYKTYKAKTLSNTVINVPLSSDISLKYTVYKIYGPTEYACWCSGDLRKYNKITNNTKNLMSLAEDNREIISLRGGW